MDRPSDVSDAHKAPKKLRRVKGNWNLRAAFIAAGQPLPQHEQEEGTSVKPFNMPDRNAENQSNDQLLMANDSSTNRHANQLSNTNYSSTRRLKSGNEYPQPAQVSGPDRSPKYTLQYSEPYQPGDIRESSPLLHSMSTGQPIHRRLSDASSSSTDSTIQPYSSPLRSQSPPTSIASFDEDEQPEQVEEIDEQTEKAEEIEKDGENQQAEDTKPTPPYNQTAEDTEPTPPHNQTAEDTEPTPPHNQTAEDTEPTPPYSQQAEDTEPTPPYNQQTEDTKPTPPYSQQAEDTEPTPPYNQQTEDTEPTPLYNQHNEDTKPTPLNAGFPNEIWLQIGKEASSDTNLKNFRLTCSLFDSIAEQYVLRYTYIEVDAATGYCKGDILATEYNAQRLALYSHTLRLRVRGKSLHDLPGAATHFTGPRLSDRRNAHSWAFEQGIQELHIESSDMVLKSKVMSFLGMMIHVHTLQLNAETISLSAWNALQLDTLFPHLTSLELIGATISLHALFTVFSDTARTLRHLRLSDLKPEPIHPTRTPGLMPGECWRLIIIHVQKIITNIETLTLYSDEDSMTAFGAPAAKILTYMMADSGVPSRVWGRLDGREFVWVKGEEVSEKYLGDWRLEHAARGVPDQPTGAAGGDNGDGGDGAAT